MVKSEFFKKLINQNWWWATKALQSTDERAKKCLVKLDTVSKAIEQSSPLNKKTLLTKCDELISHINPDRKGQTLGNQFISADYKEYIATFPNAEAEATSAYNEYTTYVSIFSEIVAFDELRKLGCSQISYIPTNGPDFKARLKAKKVFAEVKCINPPCEEEKRMILKVVEAVEVNSNYFEGVDKKLNFHFEKARKQFEAVGAYCNDSERIVFLNVLWGIDARLKCDSPEKLLTYSLHEEKFNFKVIQIQTFI